MTAYFGLNSPLYPFGVQGLGINGDWQPVDVAVLVAGPADATIDAQAASQQFADIGAYTDVPQAEIYPMLMQGLRDSDQAQGNGFLQRYLNRAEWLWGRTLQKLWRVPTLLDYVRTPLEALRHLAALVGFGPGTGQPDAVASRLDELNLRRLVKLAVPFWQRRGRRDALVDALRVLCGVRPAVLDWHWLAPLVGDAVVGELGLPGVDLLAVHHATQATAFDGSTVVLVAGGVVDGPGQVWFRVPDLDGALDRQLVMDVCALARPAGERYEVAFVDFSDWFLDGRLSHWQNRSGVAAVAQSTGSSAVDPPMLPGMEIPEAGMEAIVLPNSATWKDYIASMAVRTRDVGQSYEVIVLCDGVLDGEGYRVRVTPAASTVTLASQVGGVVTALAGGVVADPGLFTAGLRVLRVIVKRQAAEQLVRVYLDGVKVIDYVGAYALAGGTVAVRVLGATGLPVRFSAVEVFQQPLDVRTIAP